MGIVIRQSVKGTALNYVGAFIGLILQMFIAVKYLPQKEVGLIAALSYAGLVFSRFAQIGLGSSAIRFFPYFKDKENNNHGFFYYLMSVSFIGMVIFTFLYLCLKGPITDYFQTKSPLLVDYYYWVIPLGCFLLYGLVFETYSSVLMRIAIPKFIKEILLRILLIVIYILYGLKQITLNQFIAGYVGIYGFAMLAVFYYVSRIGPVNLKHEPSFITPKLRKKFLSYTSWLVIGSLGGTLIGYIDTFMVGSNIGLSSVAIYTIAYNMVAAIEIPSRSITAISSPVAAEALQAGNTTKANDLYKQVSLHQFMTASVLFLLIWVNINNIYAIIPNGEMYSAGKWVFFFVGIAKIIEVTLNFGATLISYSRYYHWSIYFVFFITGLTIVTNNLLIPIYGVSGAAIATLVTCLVSYGIQQWIIFIKIKGNPYTRGTWKQTVVILFLLGLNTLLPVFANPWLDGIYRTLLMSGLVFLFVYFGKISPQVNELVDKVFFSVWKKE
ncbi:lipopolysaccharide biosynthesis protein [Parabacteroides pacaensis]|uniref:lipopolysaccharide biosynthesis protein n=1 Tax=Parabacteroides pacaensis TaxID=2086575 RepID=UPI000D10CA9A|nr:lipopolysaccharide biosynthesis protein [Parabacteroides pacaensis]